jgi:sugar/nucleoside kinase (ribokinase family)
MASELKKIVTIGEIVVEIMADEPGYGFRTPLSLRGPYPSGAPAIFIDQVARLGHPCGLISAVGDDDFGWLNIERLSGDGVDVSAIQIVPDLVTGTAFVRYRPDGERDFVYNIKNSACSQTRVTQSGEVLLAEALHFHVMGSSLFSFRIIDEVIKGLKQVKAAGGTISFDPNIRKEMLNIPEMRAAMEIMLQYCDIFMPSGPELIMLTEANSEADAISEIFALGTSEIVVKRGARGASHYSEAGAIHLDPFPVVEIDPTGAGDCFGATYVTCRLQGETPERSLRYANASGARAVSARGPMEGVSTRAELDEFLASHGVSGQ